MKKSILVFALIGFCLLKSFGQAKQEVRLQDVTFCGKLGVSGLIGGNYTVEELLRCEMKIAPVDTNYTVTEFQMSLVPLDNSFTYTEYAIKGNTIPEEYRKLIIHHTSRIFLEKIKAVNRKGEKVLVASVAVRIIG